MKTIELIKEYGEITGRDPGWEKYLSVTEYIEFKKAAGSFTSEANPSLVMRSKVSSYSEPSARKEPDRIKKPDTGQQKRESQPPVSLSSVKEKKQSFQLAELSEIEIFKQMGE